MGYSWIFKKEHVFIIDEADIGHAQVVKFPSHEYGVNLPRKIMDHSGSHPHGECCQLCQLPSFCRSLP